MDLNKAKVGDNVELTPIEPVIQESVKHDTDKPDLSLITYASLVAEAEALMFGENKYGRNNYRISGFNSNRLIAAALRHITQWNEGEDNDKESGLSHLSHAKACLAMLITNIKEGKSEDGRYKQNKKD